MWNIIIEFVDVVGKYFYGKCRVVGKWTDGIKDIRMVEVRYVVVWGSRVEIDCTG